MTNLIRPTDSAACDLARDLMANARFAALGTLTGKTSPMVTRIAFGLTPDGEPLSLISQLAAHTTALKEDPVCSLLIGEPGPKGDPLTHPRLTLQTTADIIPRAAADHEKMAAHYLRDHPKAKLYVGFTTMIVT